MSDETRQEIVGLLERAGKLAGDVEPCTNIVGVLRSSIDSALTFAQYIVSPEFATPPTMPPPRLVEASAAKVSYALSPIAVSLLESEGAKDGDLFHDDATGVVVEWVRRGAQWVRA